MEPRPSTLNDILRRRAALTPERTAYTFLADGEVDAAEITYGELDRRAIAVAAQLHEACAPGARALLIHPPGVGFVVGFVACLYAGVAAVPAYPPRAKHARARLKAILDDARPAVAIADSGGADEELDAILGAAGSITTLATDAIAPGAATGGGLARSTPRRPRSSNIRPAPRARRGG